MTAPLLIDWRLIVDRFNPAPRARRSRATGDERQTALKVEATDEVVGQYLIRARPGCFLDTDSEVEPAT